MGYSVHGAKRSLLHGVTQRAGTPAHPDNGVKRSLLHEVIL